LTIYTAKKGMTVMPIKRVLREVESTRVDHGTGEVSESSTVVEFAVPQEPDYVKLYLNDVAYLNNVSNCSNVLGQLLRCVSYDGLIILNASIKRKITAELGISMGHFNNQLSKLAKSKVLLHRDTGMYEVNPHIFGKGSWRDILKRRKEIRVRYSSDGDRVVEYVLVDK
jgi:hypothetical protein